MMMTKHVGWVWQEAPVYQFTILRTCMLKTHTLAVFRSRVTGDWSRQFTVHWSLFTDFRCSTPEQKMEGGWAVQAKTHSCRTDSV